MRNKSLAAAGFALLIGSAPGRGAAWRSDLYPESWTPATTDGAGRFLHDFSYAGYRGGAQPIPDDPPGRTIDATAAPFGADPTGAVDSTEAIQRALDAAGAEGGGVVLVRAGPIASRSGPGSGTRSTSGRTASSSAARVPTALSSCTRRPTPGTGG
jgi:hypothetical protein